MKQFIVFLLFVLPVIINAQPQKNELSNFHMALKNAANDTIRMDINMGLAMYYNEINADSALYYLASCISISQKLNLKLNEAHALENKGYMLTKIGNYPEALQSFTQTLKIAEDPESEKNVWNLPEGHTPHKERLNVLGLIYLTTGHLYGATGEKEKQISSYHQSMAIGESIQNKDINLLANLNLGGVYFRENELDSALLYAQNALDFTSKSDSGAGKYDGGILNLIGSIYRKKGNYDLAIDAFRKGLHLVQKQNNLNGLGRVYLTFSSTYQTLNKPDSSLLYAYKGVETFKIAENQGGIARSYSLLSSAYSMLNKADSAFTYLKLATSIRDSINDAERKNLLDYQKLSFEEKMRLKTLEEEKASFKNKIRTNTLSGGLFTLLVIAFLLYRNNKQKQKANIKLQAQKEEIQTTLEQLEATQNQLIQSEKMASLGELTAGIAHEIQNPLNFVNNFSEVNTELIDEASQEIKNGNISEVEIIINDIKENEQKINHHGKRADAIVKGMLQHSRTSTGQKEPTDINALADEYLRLAYHGLRAKDNSFNADFKTEFDESLPKINVIPQDIGRVLLNLINNAFYAVDKKAKSDVDNFKPMVSVDTKGNQTSIEISVKDNGDGIPENIKDKIFQPFFTTKPTGQGTGLGLSLSYDIMKAHEGELKVESTEGKGTEFIIQIPTN